MEEIGITKEFSDTKGNPRVQMLTDDLIAMYSENNVLTEYRDIDLKVTTRVYPYPKGVYDQDIFGSMFRDRCNCGTVRTPGLRCPRCGSMVLDEVASYKRFARIECPVLFSTKFKIKKLIQFIQANFSIKVDFKGKYFSGTSWKDHKALNICQWNYDKDNETFIITDEITDFTKCSYEGLVKIINQYYPDKLDELRSYLNQYILVVPMAIRAPQLSLINGESKLTNNEITIVYQNILYCINEYYKEAFPTMKTESGKSIFRGSLRILITSAMDSLSDLMRSSKENMARYMQSNRLPNSGRCVIVPDTTLDASEVVVPRHLMYEACRVEFIKYLSEKKNISEKEAEVIYKTQSDIPEVQKLFTEYIEGDPKIPDSGKYVVINRAPTLYELGMFTCKVKLTNDYAMRIPVELCKPTNGDFDGDTFSFYAIPKEMNQMMIESLGARNRFRYKKNHGVMFTPTQDILHGLIIGTKVIVPEKLETFDSIEQAKQYRKENRDTFKYQTLCKINNKKTTLARAIFTELFDKDLDAYLGGIDKNLTAKTITPLYDQLVDYPDRLTRIRDIKEFSSILATLSGATATSVSDLYLDIDKSYLDRMKKIEDDPNLSDKSKEISIRNIYAEYQKVEIDKVPKGVYTMISESGKAKVDQLRDMAVQQLNVGPGHNWGVSETTLAKGMSQYDYINHAVENRSTQDIKQGAVPMSGYLTRQFIYLASEYSFKDGTDEGNKGILLAKKLAVGRTLVDGSIVTKNNSDDQVLVRSIITKKIPEKVITKDMLTNLFTYKVGSRIGMSLISSVTENLTQEGLKLKHGGNLYNFDPMEYLIAPEDGTLEIQDHWLIFHGKTREYKYIKCPNFVQNFATGDQYKKGDRVGINYHPVTPAYKLDSIIKLCLAKPSTMSKRYANNKKVVSQCYAISDGIISYDYVDGEYTVTVGDQQYEYNPMSFYMHPEGTKIKKQDRICTGIMDLVAYTTLVPDYIELFYYFRKQFWEVWGTELAPELIEFIYILIVNRTEEGELIAKSVVQNIYNTDSFYKSLAFADHRKTFEKIGYEGMEFISDPITSVILSLIANNNI